MNIKDTFQELETLINHAVKQVKDEEKNWDAAGMASLNVGRSTEHEMWRHFLPNLVKFLTFKSGCFEFW